MLVLFIGPFALGAALSPALVAASLGILSTFGGRGPRVLTLYLVGAAIPVGVALALAALPTVQEPREVRNIQDVVDLLLAAILIVLAIVAAVRPAAAVRPRTPSFADSRWAGPGALGLGIVMMATNISTLVLVVAAGRDLARSDDALTWRAIGYLVIVVGALLPILAPLLWRVLSPARAERGLGAVDGFIGRHGRPIAIAVCLATALYLIVRSTLVP